MSMPLKSDTLLKTIHGSHLYGLAHTNSDEDWYVVTLGGRSKQGIIDGIDTNQVTLEQFQKSIAKGVPQAVEALYSPYAEFDPQWEQYFRSLRPGAELIQTYRRTIINFGVNWGGRHGAALDRAKSTDKVKLRRHAFRLCINLSQFVSSGVINPVLTDTQKNTISDAAEFRDSLYETVLEQVLAKSIMGEWNI